MTARAHSRGWPIVYTDRWVFADTGAPDNGQRPCRRCGFPPTSEGFDACLGRIQGATAACCGHGVNPGYVMMESAP